MNRRELLQFSLLSALPLGLNLPLQATPATTASRKKGLGLTSKKVAQAPHLTNLRCKWFYSWASQLPAGTPKEIAFVPMIWGRHATQNPIAPPAGAKELLGFNEPDGKEQANMSVDEALAAWNLLDKTELCLGSPGCVHPDGEWMKTFMQAAKTRKLKVDFVCLHSYGGGNSDAFIKMLHRIHELYGKPIWITEFAVADWKAKTIAENKHKPADVLRFMEAVLPKLEQLDFIERYAWFPAEPNSAALGTSSLFDDTGKLSRLGECYRDA